MKSTRCECLQIVTNGCFVLAEALAIISDAAYRTNDRIKELVSTSIIQIVVRHAHFRSCAVYTPNLDDHYLIYCCLQENSNEILAIQRSLTDFEGNLVTPSRVFLKKGELQKSSRKTETPRMFFLVCYNWNSSF